MGDPRGDLRHDARRDTMWLGKGVPWTLIFGVLALGVAAALIF